MKFLIAGYGSIGRRHLRNLQLCGENDLFLLRSHQSTLPEDEIRHIPVVTDIEEALKQKPDGVIIANIQLLSIWMLAIPGSQAAVRF
jgi:ketopantoate reductase